MDKVKTVQDDAIAYMKTLVEQGRTFDIVVLDPPKLAPNARDLRTGNKAYKMYRMINTLGMKLVEPGGMLLSCTCSGAMTNAKQSLGFQDLLWQVSKDSKRRIRTLKVMGSAMCHPTNTEFPQGAYLTAVLMHVL